MPDSKLAPFAHAQQDHWRIALHVDGIHCAKCIWAIESTLAKEPVILEARVNMSTARLVIEWQGDVTQADYFAELVEKLGYHVKPLTDTKTTHSSETSRLMRYMAISGFAMGNIMLISVALWSSSEQVMGVATRELLHWVSALIALPTIAYAGQPFFCSALAALRARRTNMDVPISLALILASGMSLFETIEGGEHVYFDSAVMLLFFLLIGRWLDSKARGKARHHAVELLELLRGAATVLQGDKTHTVAISELRAGDMVIIAAGEKVPSDAIIRSGISEMDTSLVTGESLPKNVAPGDKLYGGTINLSAPLTCEILQASEDSMLAEVIRLMENAEQGRARYTRLADRAAQLYTPVVHTLAAGAFIGWTLIGGMVWQDALLIAITTLIITCPCALGLAVPVVQVLTTSWLMKRGVIVKSADALERLTQIDTVIFDKTGTLTIGKPMVESFDGDETTRQYAASLAAHSKHPLSQAISANYAGGCLPASHIKEMSGKGIEGMIDGTHVFIGRSTRPAETTTVNVMMDHIEKAHFTFHDQLRDDAANTIQAFKNQQLKTLLLSGDSEAIVASMAERLSIEHYKAEILPNEKLNTIKELQSQGHHCFMVGDGLNDAPALAQADVSMSPSTGIDITQNTADMIFQGNSLKAVPLSYKAAKHSTTLIKQNFALAVFYNCCAIPLAVMGYVTPLVAAIAMSSSSLLVIGNSFRIHRLKEG